MPKAKTPKRKLTTAAIDRLRARGRRYELRDTLVPGLCMRVSERGARTFVLKTRFPGSSNPTRRALGEYPVLTLEEAREKAREWLRLKAKGIDPAEHEKARRFAEHLRRKNTFAAVAADFSADKLSKERRGDEVKREMERDLTPTLAGRPITDITDDEIAAIIKAKARTAPVQARNLLATVKRFFQWAIDQRAYGLKSSPAAGLKPASLCGERIVRDRTLSNDEIAALWYGACKIGYPHGFAYQLLLLTGLRLNEVADAAYSEIDRKEGAWTIPADRMKGRNSKSRSHVVPLTDEVVSVIDGLPRFSGGNFVFSTTDGKKPTWIGATVKNRLDDLMLDRLRVIAKARREDPDKVKLVPWRNHDIRRTVRSQLSRLKIAEEVREAVLAHVRPGIKGVYDQYKYFDEKREALDLWARELKRIVEPRRESKVVRLKATR